MSQAQSPTSAARRFNVFIQGDATLTSSETEGPVAIGGNVTTNQYQISFNKQYGAFFVNNASIGLAVRGAVKLNSGSLTINGENYVKIGQPAPADGSASSLKVWYKDNNGAASTIRITEDGRQYWDTPNITINANVYSYSPAVSEGVNPVFENIFGTGENQIDIDGAFTTFIRRSGQLKEMADNLPIRDQNGNIMPNAPVGPYLDPSVIGNNPKIIVDPGKINVLTVSAAVWSRIGNANIEGIPSGPQLGQAAYSGSFGLIVNIVDVPAYKASTGSTTVSFPGFGGLSDPQGSYVLYNFPDAAGTLTLGGNAQISGTIFAPQADLIKENNGNINGQVIAKTFRHNRDEIHFWPFLPSIAEPVQKQIKVTTNSRCADNAPYLDYDIAANFDTKGQTAKIEWINAEGKVVQEDNDKPLSGSVLFPGAAVDENGKGMAWPGWEKQNGKWVQVDDRYASLCNEGAQIRVTIGVYETMEITYPASSNGCYTTPPPAAPLPVRLASFTAENESCNARLKWTVAEASHFSHFVVERSADAVHFTALAQVDYDANQKTYTFTDNPYAAEYAPARYYYYRLQQVDEDDTFEYSVIRSVEAGTCDARLAINFYPNPTQDKMNVKSFSPVQKLEIYNLAGKQMYQLTPGPNETELSVNVQAFAQGMYIVNVINQEGKHTSQILKR